jgi:hypothetical protein
VKKQLPRPTIEPAGKAKAPQLPDFEARLNKIFGDRIVEPSGAELIREDREER